MPEMPTRFAKQLTQIIRGGLAIGMGADAAMRLAIRCAKDSMPPLRLAILEDLWKCPDSQLADVRRRLDMPRSTVKRQLESLHLLQVLTCTESQDQYEEHVEVEGEGQGAKTKTTLKKTITRRYRVVDRLRASALEMPITAEPVLFT